jgi:hypothetical protein
MGVCCCWWCSCACSSDLLVKGRSVLRGGFCMHAVDAAGTFSQEQTFVMSMGFKKSMGSGSSLLLLVGLVCRLLTSVSEGLAPRGYLCMHALGAGTFPWLPLVSRKCCLGRVCSKTRVAAAAATASPTTCLDEGPSLHDCVGRSDILLASLSMSHSALSR